MTPQQRNLEKQRRIKEVVAEITKALTSGPSLGLDWANGLLRQRRQLWNQLQRLQRKAMRT